MHYRDKTNIFQIRLIILVNFGVWNDILESDLNTCMKNWRYKKRNATEGKIVWVLISQACCKEGSLSLQMTKGLLKKHWRLAAAINIYTPVVFQLCFLDFLTCFGQAGYGVNSSVHLSCINIICNIAQMGMVSLSRCELGIQVSLIQKQVSPIYYVC